MTGLIVQRRKTEKNNYEYLVDENSDLPLSRRQLSILLNKCCRIDVHEIAFMHESWERNEHHRTAYFDTVGVFMGTD